MDDVPGIFAPNRTSFHDEYPWSLCRRRCAGFHLSTSHYRRRFWLHGCHRCGTIFRSLPLMFHVLVHYHELALKGRNRKHFEYRLVHHIRRALKPLTHVHVDCPARANPRQLRRGIGVASAQATITSAVFGIVNFSLTRSVPLSLR